MTAAMLAQWLTGPGAVEILAAAAALTSAPGDHTTLSDLQSLRRAFPDLSGEHCGAAMTQATLRCTAQQRYGIDGNPFLTRGGLEQATRPVVAERRAQVLAAAGVQRVADLTAGLGFDAAACLAAGLSVTAVERDPETAVFLAANLPDARVLLGDATDPEVLASALSHLLPTDAIFIDPARRDQQGRRTADGSRAQSERDPERWSPPWSFVQSLTKRGHRVCLKTTPGFSPTRLPLGWHGEWVSVDRVGVEATLYSWPAFEAPRRAVQFTGRSVTVLEGSGPVQPSFEQPATEQPATEQPDGAASGADSIGRWLHEPDTSVISAGLLDGLCTQLPGLRRIDVEQSWLTSSDPLRSPFLRSLECLEQLPTDEKGLRRALRERDIGTLTIKGRGTGIDPEALRTRLRLTGSTSATIVIILVGGRRIIQLVEPC
jgi:hypothetical protein